MVHGQAQYGPMDLPVLIVTKGLCYHIEACCWRKDQYIAYVAYPLDLLKKVTYLGSKPLGFYVRKICESLPLMLKLSKVRLGIQVERDKLNKYGRPLWDVLLNLNWGYLKKLRESGVPIVMHDYLTGIHREILPWLIIAEIMVYFFTSTVQCMRLLIDVRIMVSTFVLAKAKHIEVAVFISLKIESLYRVFYPVASWRYSRFGICLARPRSGDDSALRFGGGTLGHPWGNAPCRS
ncbi:hypothetical protein H5410_056290 [Solanum commersonii]|uniref:Ribulose bisphosphate carboxylase large chain n=1 Tax=Solanum commersonii TaxID=4109 RepID=A0A9J5WLU6_SOLCO|nr:hypothetical protein H5410_056290 [Solanum commersonii]